MTELNLKNIRTQFKENGVFYTPKEDAERLKNLIDIEYKEVYDPTCGQGNLLAVFDDNIKKYGQELDNNELEKAKEILKNFEGYCGDTLKDDKFKDKQFDLIIANPPFSVKWEPIPDDERFNICDLAPKSKADWAFNLHIVNHLKPDGEAIALAFPGTAYRGNSEQKIRKYFIDNNYIDKVIAYPANTFIDTSIPTLVYIFKKNRTKTTVIFINDKGIEKEVSKEEIEKENYDLSPTTYIPEEKIKEEINIDQINEQIEDGILRDIIRQARIRHLFYGREKGIEFCLKLQSKINKFIEEMKYDDRN